MKRSKSEGDKEIRRYGKGRNECGRKSVRVRGGGRRERLGKGVCRARKGKTQSFTKPQKKSSLLPRSPHLPG